MTRGHQFAGLVFVLLLGWLAGGLLSPPGPRLLAGPRPPFGQPVQYFPTPEPPLAGSNPAPRPAPAPVPAPAPGPAPAPCLDTPNAPGPVPELPDEPPVPVVKIHVRVPASAAAGQDLEYHLCVENCSQAAAHHVLVRNPLPANARFVRANPEPTSREPELQWQLGTLAACACREIVLVLSPTGTGDVQDCARVQFEYGQCVSTKITGAPANPAPNPPVRPAPLPAGKPALSIQKHGPAQAMLYDALNYQLVVTNTGNAEATGVAVIDTLPAGLEPSSGKNPLTWNLGTLAAGQSRTMDYQVVAKTAGRLCNHAVVTAAGGLRQEAESCVTVREAKLNLTMTGPAQRYVNLPATYQLTVSNTGTVSIPQVLITNPLPIDSVFVSANGGGLLTGNQVQWSIGTLDAGKSRTVELVLRAQNPGAFCNRATATADRGLVSSAEVCTRFTGQPGLQIGVEDTVDPVEVGGETRYVITIFNQGTRAVTRLVV
ncbi:MAG: DUF11 domain-containing protein, partial [Planctomycetes bacterium]|nr:DUF11 domain-containing protein [Planctomycetota bacterium]